MNTKTESREMDIPEDFLDEIVASEPDIADILDPPTNEKSGKSGQKDGAKPKEDAKADESEDSTDSDSKKVDESEDEPAEKDDDSADEDAKEHKDAEEEDKEDKKPDEGDDKGQETYEDDVIPGVKGAQFAALPDEMKVALDQYVSTMADTKEKATKAEQDLAAILDDPVVRDRVRMVQAGQTQYAVPGLTEEDRRRLQSELGLEPEEVTKVESILKEKIETGAQALANNVRLSDHLETQRKAMVTTGNERLMELGKFHKSFKLEGVKDLQEVIEKGLAHPQFKAFEAGIGRAIRILRDAGWTYGQIAKVDAKQLYGFVAPAMGLPVAINTDERDLKIAADAKRSALKNFKRVGAEARGLPSNPSGSERTSREKLLVDGGIDAVKLADDPEYYETVLNRKPGDQDWMAKIDQLVDKGRSALKERRKR